MPAMLAAEAIKLSEARKTECAEIVQERSRKFEERRDWTDPQFANCCLTSSP